MAYYRKMTRRHDYGGATPRQRAYIATLAAQIAGTSDLLETSRVMKAHGAPCNDRGALTDLTKFQASLLIESLLRAIEPNGPAREYARAVSYCPPDPGELAADRWNEAHA